MGVGRRAGGRGRARNGQRRRWTSLEEEPRRCRRRRQTHVAQLSLSLLCLSLFLIDRCVCSQRRVSRDRASRQDEAKKRRAESKQMKKEKCNDGRQSNSLSPFSLFKMINSFYYRFFFPSSFLSSHISRFWICLCSQQRYSTYEGPAALLSSGSRRARALVASRGGCCCCCWWYCC